METEIYLFEEFKKWCKEQFKSGAASDYPSRLKRLNRDFLSHLDTGTKSTVFELLKKYMTSSTKGPKIKLIKAFLEVLQSCITKRLEELKAKSNPVPTVAEFSSERSAFRKYVEFLLWYVMTHEYRNDAICPTEEAVLKKLEGEAIVLDGEDLISNFALRIKTQDRISGEKTYFPLGLIDKIPGSSLNDWAREEAKKVIFHLENSTVTAADVERLVIDTTTGKVTVDIINGEKGAEVFNPPIENRKSLLRIFKLSDAHLDHRPEIHDILVKLNGELPGLDLLTQEMLKAKKEEGIASLNAKNVDKVYARILGNPGVMGEISRNISQIMADVRSVSNHHILQFASANWNLSDVKQAKKKKV